MRPELEPIFNPKSVAVIGASRREGSIGNQVTKNLIEGKYPGPIYPINPGAGEILGLKAYPSIGDVPGPVDAAIYCVPADKVLEVARECAKVGVKGHIVITSGFGEVGKREDENAGQDRARLRRTRHRPQHRRHHQQRGQVQRKLCAYPGRTALISQSGAGDRP